MIISCLALVMQPSVSYWDVSQFHKCVSMFHSHRHWIYVMGSRHFNGLSRISFYCNCFNPLFKHLQQNGIMKKYFFGYCLSADFRQKKTLRVIKMFMKKFVKICRSESTLACRSRNSYEISTQNICKWSKKLSRNQSVVPSEKRKKTKFCDVVL